MESLGGGRKTLGGPSKPPLCVMLPRFPPSKAVGGGSPLPRGSEPRTRGPDRNFAGSDSIGRGTKSGTVGARFIPPRHQTRRSGGPIRSAEASKRASWGPMRFAEAPNPASWGPMRSAEATMRSAEASMRSAEASSPKSRAILPILQSPVRVSRARCSRRGGPPVRSSRRWEASAVGTRPWRRPSRTSWGGAAMR